MFHIDPIAHFVGDVGPAVGVFHHLFAAGLIVVGNADAFADVLFGDAEHLLNAQFHGQSVRIPSGLALHLEPFQGFIAADGVLYGTRHHVVNARHTVCGGRSLVEHECGVAVAGFNALFKCVVVGPALKHLLIDAPQVKPFVFVEFGSHFMLIIVETCLNIARKDTNYSASIQTRTAEVVVYSQSIDTQKKRAASTRNPI